MSVWSRIKRWFTGGGSTSNSSRPSSNNRSSTTRASRVSNYGGGGSRSVRNYNSRTRRYYEDREAEQQTSSANTETRQQRTTNALASISKRTDALSSGNSISNYADSKKSNLDRVASQSRTGNGTTRALAKIAEKTAERTKANPPETKPKQKTKTISDNRAALNKATNNKYNTEAGTKEERLRARQRIKSGELNADPEAARVSFEQHPIANLAGRKVAQGMSFGLSDLAERKLGGDRYAEERRLYEQAEKEHPWIAGGAEMAGALVSFGGTAGMAEKAGAKLTAKVAPKAAEKLATKKIIQKSASRAVNKAVKKGLVGEASEELIKQVGEAKAKKIMTALGTDVVQNWTTGLVYDVATASKYHEVGSADWWKELGKSAAFNRIATGAIAGGSMLTGGKRLAAEAAEQLGRASSAKRSLRGSLKVKGKAKALRPGADEAVENAVERNADDVARTAVNNADNVRPQNINEAVERTATETVERNADDVARATETKAEPPRKLTKNEQKRQAFQEERDNLVREYEAIKNDASVPQAEKQAMLDDMQELDLEIKDLDARIAKAQKRAATKKTTPPQADANAVEAEARTEPPNIKEETVNAESAKVEPPEASDAANTRSEIIKDVRESQTREESEKLMQDYFSEYGEADLGIYGKITKNSDDTYTLSINGARGKTLTEEEARKRISKAVKNAYEDSRKINSIEDMIGRKRQQATTRERINTFAKSVRTKISDSLAAFEDEARKKAKTDHQGMLDDYGAIDKLRRYKGIATRSIKEKQLKWNQDAYENGKSLMEIFGGMDEETEKAFNAYLLLKHAPDRLNEGKSIFSNIELKELGLNLDDAEVCAREAEKRLKEHPEFAEKAEEVYKYTRNELQNRVDAGLLPQSVADEWNAKYPFYVPTGRTGYFNGVHGDYGAVTGAGELRPAKGSDYDIWDIKQQLADATTRNWRDMSMNNMFRRMFGDNVANELAGEADGGLEKVLDNTITLSKSREHGKYYANIFEDGKPKKVEIDKRFYDAIEDMYKNGRFGNGIDIATDVLSKYASQPFKALVTSWNPIFMVKNGLRDLSEAIINTRQTKEFLECMGPAIKDLHDRGPFSEALMNSGVSQSNFVNLEETLTGGKTLLGKGVDKFATLQDLVETYPRLVEYMATLKKAGVDINDPNALKNVDMTLRDRAAVNAADVTVNFGRSGSVGKMLNRGLVPFFNPSVQGWSKFIRNFSEQEGVKPTLALIAKATALGAGATTLNNLMLEDNPNYQMISARDKATNYIIPVTIGGATRDTADTFIKIPKSRFAAVYSIPTVNTANENDMGWAEMIKVAKDQVGPVGPLESNIYAPFTLAGDNETWYGTPIVPGALEDLPPSEQYDANTSYIGRALGKATENLPKELQISPKKADYVIDAETGVIGDFLLPATTPSRQGGGKSILAKGGYALANVPKRAFTIDSATQNDLSTRFYDQLQDATTNKKSAKATEEDEAEYKRLNSYSTEASDLTKAIKEMQGSNRPDKQEAVRGLQKVRNQLMLDALNGNDVPAKAKTVDAVQKYVGTSYAIDNFGSSSDKEAMKVYGLAKYGKLSDEDMAKKIDADKDFYKGVQAIGNLEDKLASSGVSKSTTTLGKAVALADAGAGDYLYGAYEASKKGRAETADKMTRAKTYMSSGGSTDEFIKLEKARKDLGKLKDFDKSVEEDKIDDQLAKGEITQDEWHQKKDEIEYNANISYVGLATSLAESNAPERGYRLYDIKDKNIQKGINLAAMGYDARSYREMAKAVDANGNGYPSKQEVVDYVANSDVEDKATLFDALYYYKSSKNPFGTPTNYTREQAATAGKNKGVEQITDEKGDIALNAEQSSSGSGYSKGYRRRRGYSRRGYSKGSSKKAELPKAKEMKASQFVKGEALVSKKSSSSSKKAEPPKLKRVQAKIDLPTKR